MFPRTQAAIAAEAEEAKARKLKGRAEMERMLAANRDLHEIRAGRVSEEIAVREHAAGMGTKSSFSGQRENTKR